MIRKIPFETTRKALMAIFILVVIFHAFVLAGLLPSDMVWGGKFQNPEELKRFEVVSILINLLLLGLVFTHPKTTKDSTLRKITTGLLWLFVALFFLNTIGNLFAENILETLIFTPVTFISALLCWRMAVN